MSLPDADVIVTGAGPAGAVAAYRLAKQGFRVIILEKLLFPRYKVCGGGLTHKILGELPFPVDSVIEASLHSVRFSHKFTHVFSRTSPDPLIYCTMRDELDNLLLSMATSAGATVFFEEQVTGIEQDNEIVRVMTKRKKYSARVVIGAEGASRTVARLTGLSGNISMGLAWEAEITADPGDILKYSQTAFLDWGTFPGGYAWVFPKKNHFSIGVGGPASLSSGMMRYYDLFIKSTGIRFLDTRSLRSWPIPVRTKKSRFHRGHVLIAGDAAGLTDPLTGEGIYYAVKSANIAAAVSADFLNGTVSSLDPYSERINGEIMEELMEANRIRYIFNTVPLKIHGLVRDNERIWGGFIKILRGERVYRDVRRGFGKWKNLWDPLTAVLKHTSGWKEYRYGRRIRKDI